MHQLNGFGVFSLSSILKGIANRNQKSNYFLKYKTRVAFVIIIITLVIIYSLKTPSFGKTQKSKKTKRSVYMTAFKGDEDLKAPIIDIEVIPQSRQNNQHPNHKYTEKEHSQTLIRRLNAREGWYSEPFDINIGQGENVPIKGVQKPKEQSKLMADSGPSMRLKGIYLKSEDQFNGKYLNSREINNLMLNNFNEEKELFVKSTGAPFRLPGKERESFSRKKVTQENNQTLKKHPITMYLEFYPMNDYHGKFKPSLSTLEQSENGLPISDIGYSINSDKRNRMIMKLNLYPKESKIAKHPFAHQRRIYRSKYGAKPMRKSFGWFFKQKKNTNPKECTIIGIHPHGKRIKAKWKNEKGEWIYADHVAVKNLKKRKNCKTKKFYTKK